MKNRGRLTKFFLASISIFFLLSSCLERQKVQPLMVKLEKELEIGISAGDENYMFAGVIDVEVDSEENIYVLDWKYKTIKKYDKKGEFLENIGQKGQGPGEFSAILVDSCLDKNDRLYVLELRKVHVFEANGKFIHSFLPDFFPMGIMADEDGNIILSGERGGQIFHVYDAEGKFIRSFGELWLIPERLRKFYNFRKKIDTRTVHLSQDGKLLIFNPFQYEMDVYEGDKLKRRMTGDNPNYRIPELAKNENGEELLLNTFAQILETNDYIFIWLATEIKDYVLGEMRYLDLYDKRDYKFLGTTAIREKGIPAAIRNDKIFFDDQEDDFPRVLRYRIVYQKSRDTNNSGTIMH